MSALSQPARGTPGLADGHVVTGQPFDRRKDLPSRPVPSGTATSPAIDRDLQPAEGANELAAHGGTDPTGRRCVRREENVGRADQNGEGWNSATVARLSTLGLEPARPPGLP